MLCERNICLHSEGLALTLGVRELVGVVLGSNETEFEEEAIVAEVDGDSGGWKWIIVCLSTFRRKGSGASEVQPVGNKMYTVMSMVDPVSSASETAMQERASNTRAQEAKVALLPA